MSTCAAQDIKYLRNPHYWQSTPGHPVPTIQEVDYPAFLSNTPANLFLAQGQAQWGGQYIPNVQSFYVAKDPAHRHIWYPPVLNVSLVPNLQNPLLSQFPVRQALARRSTAPRSRGSAKAASSRRPTRPGSSCPHTGVGTTVRSHDELNLPKQSRS